MSKQDGTWRKCGALNSRAPVQAQGGDTETILIVEDQESVRDLLKTFLEQRGYTVLAAQDGEEAKCLFYDYPNDIDLLVTDVVLPGMDGSGVARLFLERRPTTQVLFISGFGEEVLPDASAAFLRKPFHLEELATTVRGLLQNRSGCGPS